MVDLLFQRLGDLVVGHGFLDDLVVVHACRLEDLDLVGLPYLVVLYDLEVGLVLVVLILEDLILVVLSVVELLVPCFSSFVPWLLP